MTEQELCTKAEEMIHYILPQAIKPWRVNVDPDPFHPEGTEDRYIINAFSGRFQINMLLTRTAIEDMSRESLSAPKLVRYMECTVRVEDISRQT